VARRSLFSAVASLKKFVAAAFGSVAVRYVECGHKKGKGKGLPYLLTSVGPGADPSVQAVIHPAVGCITFCQAWFTFSAAEHHRLLAVPSYTAW